MKRTKRLNKLNKDDKVKRYYTIDELKDDVENWKAPFYYHFLWTWWDVREFFAELSYYLRKLLRIIESKLKRNGFPEVVYLDCDSWSLDYRIADLIIFGVKRIRERGIGYPYDLSMGEWRRILLDIERGFEEWIKLHELKYKFGSDEEKQAQEKVEKAFDLLKEYFHDLWD